MKKQLLAATLCLVLASPAQAFSLKTPVKKTGHALKVAAKKVGQVALYAVAVLAVIEFCAHGGCE